MSRNPDSKLIRKAVIPAAGLGTRFLPITKAIPKEMLPVWNKPVIHYVVEEAVHSGITEILLVVSRGKECIIDYFDRDPELELRLAEKHLDSDPLAEVKALTDRCRIHYVRQPEMKGLGDAILQAEGFIGDETFAVLLGDTILRDDPPVTRQLIALHEQCGGGVVALEAVPEDRVHRYGIVDPVDPNQSPIRIKGMIEKPGPGCQPSNLAFCARYVLSAGIFRCLNATPPGKDQEIQLTDAMRMLLETEPLFGVKLGGKRFDVGNPQGLKEVTDAFAKAL